MTRSCDRCSCPAVARLGLLTLDGVLRVGDLRGDCLLDEARRLQREGAKRAVRTWHREPTP